MDTTTATALANEARQKRAAIQEAKRAGALEIVQRITSFVVQLSTDAERLLADAKTAKTELELSIGPGVTDDFGPRSVFDREIEEDRETAMLAVIDLVLAGSPTETEAGAAFAAASKYLKPSPVLKLYYRKLAAQTRIPAETWDDFATWVRMNGRDVAVAELS